MLKTKQEITQKENKKKYQIVINNGKGLEAILSTTNKTEAELVYDGYKATHIVAILESDIDF